MSPEALDDAGFRIRGVQATRVDAFVDAAFAFAVTLLVVSIGRVPTTVAELQLALRGVPAFAASFFVIARFWQAHRNWSRRYGIDDTRSVRLSLALVFLVLVYVYPLRMIAELTLASMSGGLLAETEIVIGSIAELRTLYSVFGIGYALTAAIFWLLHREALERANVLAHSQGERIRTKTLCRRWLGVIAVALTSTALALALPMDEHSGGWVFSAPGLLYGLLYVIFHVLKLRERRELAMLPAMKDVR
jgi:uncharacterized membrane protein